MTRHLRFCCSPFRALFVAIHCLLAGLAVQAQGIYEIKFQMFSYDSQNKIVWGDEHTGLVFYYDEKSENNIMRSRFYMEGRGWIVVEQKINSAFYTIGGKNYWVLSGKDPRFITPVGPDLTYSPDTIAFSKYPADQYYQPAFAWDKNNIGGKINSFKVLERSQVNNDYLAQFEWKWPSETTQDLALQNATLHLILVTNTLDPSLGAGFAANHRKLKALFRDAALSSRIRFNAVEITDDRFTSAQVKAAIANLRTGPNDIVVFYYSGHGFRHPGSRTDFPQMDLREGAFQVPDATNTLNLDFDIFQPLRMKNQRLLLVVGDCCNKSSGYDTPYISDPIFFAPGGNVMSSTKVASLFVRKGSVLIASSSPDEWSFYDGGHGGYFCTAFIEYFMNRVSFANTDNAISWRDIIDNAMLAAKRKSQTDRYPEAVQTPIVYFNIE